jgi:acetyl-CoA C-acetyltransferase
MSQHSPVIIGVAQFNPRRAGLAQAPEPLEMMAHVAQAAAEDSGAPDVLKSLDALAAINILSFNYNNPPNALATRLKIAPRTQLYTTISGSSPVHALNHLAVEIAAGRVRAAMVVGAEAFHTIRRAMKAGGVKWGAISGEGKPEILGDPRSGMHPLEERYGVRLPTLIYPMFDNARRAKHGWSIETHRAKLGKMCAAMTRVAAKNHYAWFPEEHTADEITTPTADNRIISFPYPKLMNAIMDVDLAAALIITSEEEARRLKVPQHKMVYVMAGADATEHRFFVHERDHFHSSPAMHHTHNKCLELAGVSTSEISYFDFYSCFPAAIGLALDALGIADDDPRGVTMTGGLPYAGGPASNYVTHSTAAMVERLRAEPGKIGMVTGLGWFFTKHGATLLSTAEPRRPFAHDKDDGALTPNDPPPIRIAEQAEGQGTIETYGVTHDREGEPTQGVVIGRLNDGARFLARTPREVLSAMEHEEFVGRRGKVSTVEGLNLFDPR